MLLGSASLALTLLALGLLLLAGYLLMLAIAALVGRAAMPAGGPAKRRFAILVPAHNEALLIGRLLSNLRALDYPADRFQVCVVADNCDDRTAALARSHGASVFERHDQQLQGKGFALRWLLEQLATSARRFDAYVVLDADCIVTPNFLDRMDARLEAGSQAIQAYYTVLNAGESPVATLRYAALAALHYLRPLGRAALGLSCGLKGTGMCLAAELLQRFAWQWFTLAEDAEFHLALARAGVRVDFAPEASVLADMPTTLAQAESQNSRWERGRLHLLLHRVPGLLGEGIRRRSLLRLDAAADQFIPPLSVPYALGTLCLVGAIGLAAPLPALLAASSLVGQTLYILTGLALVGAPRSAYLALGYAPAYIVWKLGLYGRAILTSRTGRWIRTARIGTGGAASAPAAPPIPRS